ncbi:MAG: WYL domain-containing protein, partial [Cyanobacteria bacterium]|nr:WYL domain-containing protein [Cyanobacteriota bacterium]
TYHTPRIGKDEQVVAFPLLMVFHERGWYCIMRDMNDANYRPRRLDRIKKCRLAQEAIVNASASDDLKEANYLLSCGWGMSFPLNTGELKTADNQPPIVVRFDRTMAPFIMEAVERHPRATISRVKDGTGSVDFSIRLCQPQEFIQWVRSFGGKAIILSPSNILEQEKAEIRRVLDRYSAHGPT